MSTFLNNILKSNFQTHKEKKITLHPIGIGWKIFLLNNLEVFVLLLWMKVSVHVLLVCLFCFVFSDAKKFMIAFLICWLWNPSKVKNNRWQKKVCWKAIYRTCWFFSIKTIKVAHPRFYKIFNHQRLSKISNKICFLWKELLTLSNLKFVFAFCFVLVYLFFLCQFVIQNVRHFQL